LRSLRWYCLSLLLTLGCSDAKPSHDSASEHTADTTRANTAQPSPTALANDSGAKVRVPNDSAARVAIDAYLKAAAYTAGPMPDSLSTCDEDYSPDKRLALASFRVLVCRMSVTPSRRPRGS
jgi:hypothetical protein